MASRAIGRPFNLPDGGRASVSIEVVSRWDFRSLRSGKAVRQLFVQTDRGVRYKLHDLYAILASMADGTENSDVTRYVIEREVITPSGGRLTVTVRVWVKGATDHDQVAGWLASVMQNDDDTLDLSAGKDTVLCPGVVGPESPESSGEHTS